MHTLKSFWSDETGVILSAELVTIGTLAVVGMTVGLNSVTSSVNAEMTDLAKAIRSLNQSYSVRGFSSCRAWTAGSFYTQEAVATSIADICACAAAGANPANITTDGTFNPFSTLQPSVSDEETAPPAPATPAEEKIPVPVEKK